MICLMRTSLIPVLDRRFNAFGSADPERSLVINLKAVFTVQVVIDSPISFGWILLVDFFYLLGYEDVLPDSFTDIAAQPLVIC